MYMCIGQNAMYEFHMIASPSSENFHAGGFINFGQVCECVGGGGGGAGSRGKRYSRKTENDNIHIFSLFPGFIQNGIPPIFTFDIDTATIPDAVSCRSSQYM